MIKNTIWILAILMFAPIAVQAIPGTIEVDIDGNPTTINYDAIGVKVNSIEANLNFVSLLLQLDVPGYPGILDITFDRSSFDSIGQDGTDQSFIIIGDGDELSHDEILTTIENRTLSIKLDPGIGVMEIIGTKFNAGTYVQPTKESHTKAQEPTLPEKDQITDGQCVSGTTLKNGICVLNTSKEPITESQPTIEEPIPPIEDHKEKISSNKIPEWVKGIFNFWVEEKISDDDLKEALKFLINNGVIVL